VTDTHAETAGSGRSGALSLVTAHKCALSLARAPANWMRYCAAVNAGGQTFALSSAGRAIAAIREAHLACCFSESKRSQCDRRPTRQMQANRPVAR
jgi:hypothetical protein